MGNTGNQSVRKVLFVHEHLGAFGGAEANILLTATELKQRGYELALAYRSATGKAESAWLEVFKKCIRLPQSGSPEVIEAALEDFSPDLIYLHNLQDLEAQQALIESGLPVLRMVHDHSLYCLRGYKYNYFTRRICTRPASGHCIFPCLATLARNREGGFPIKWASLEEKQRELALNRRCSGFIVYSDYSRQELVRNGFPEEKIHIHVPIRCWGEDAPVSSFSNRNLILFAGQIIRGKGVDALLRSLHQVKQTFECLILGDGSHRRKCERLCRRLGLQDRVHFQGYVLPDEMRRFYLEATVFAFSSLWPEPFGMAGPEAMRYGVPVVGFDAGGVREWLEDGENGFLVPWNDTKAYAARLDQLLSNKDLARRLGQNGREHVNSEYRAESQVSRLDQIIQSLARHHIAASFDARNRPAQHEFTYERTGP